MESKKSMLEGNIASQLLLFFMPIMLGSIFQQLYNTVDAIVVGNFVGKEALAAVGGSTGTVIALLVNFVVGLSSGATVVIAQYYGNHHADGVRKGVSGAILLSLVLGVFMMTVGIVFAPAILELLNVPQDILSYSISYMRIYLTGMIPTLIYNNGSGILRAVGDSRRPLYFLIASCLTNIVLDIVFVVFLGLGVQGVALATVISQTVSCTLTLYVLSHAHDMYAFHLRDLRHVDFAVLKRILSIGFPVGIQGSLYGFANLFVQRSVNAYGTDMVAAYTAFGKIDAIFWNSSGALGQAVLTFCGQNFGAGKIDRVKKGIRTGVWMYVVGAGLISLVCYVFGENIYHLFTGDAQVILLGVQLMQFLCPFWACFVFVEIFSSSIRSCGDSLVPMILTAVGIGAFRILWILLYPAKNIYQTLACYPISWIVTSLLFLGYYLQGGWLKRSLRQREKMMSSGESKKKPLCSGC